MDELFRFVALRPPTPSSDAIIVDGTSPLAVSLAEARRVPNGRDEMQKLAQSFVKSDDFVGDASSLTLRLEHLADGLDDADVLDRSTVEMLVERSLGAPAAAVVQSPDFSADLARLQDSVLAIKLAPPGDGDAATVLRLLRATDVVQRVAAGREDFGGSTGRLVLLPASIFPLSPGLATDAVPPAEPSGPSPEQTQRELVTRAEALGEALRALQVAEQMTASSAREITDARVVAPPPGSKERRRERANVPFSSQASALLLDTAAVSRLSPAVQQTLTKLGFDPTATTLPSMLHSLKIELGTAVSKVGTKLPASVIEALGLYFPYNPLVEPQPHDDSNDPKPAVLMVPPATHGKVAPAGIADLLVVRQHVLGYAAGEVAYVENVAQGETLVRTTRRSETIEDVTVTVRETSREQQRDVQATDRFDIRRESNEVLRSDSTRESGSPGSAAYGVFLETGSSTEQAQRAAETFGHDVATRAVSRVTERLRTEMTHRRVQDFSEEVRHEFDNGAGAGHEIFVYQWLDRVVQAQVFSYGKRLFYDFVLPEPGALLVRALAKRHSPSGPLVKPAPFTLKASEISDVNYAYYTAGYGATGVEPPPEPTIVVAESFVKAAANIHAAGQPHEYEITHVESKNLKIPTGYRAVKARIRTWSDHHEGVGHTLAINVGMRLIDLEAEPDATRNLDGEIGFVPVALATTENLYIYIVNVEILCEPTERRMDEWRQRTSDAILQASRQRTAEYEERAANLRASVRMDALNFTLERKRSTEREELERACLAVLTNQHFDGLSAIEHSADGYPQPFLPNVEPLGRYVRFLQQAFEWEQMTWRTYPYFWGRKLYWLDKLLLDDNDPQFRDFLRAGSARVLLSVRPGFEGALAHFMETGQVPTVAELGQMASKLYLPFLAEETGSDVAIESATPYGEPWTLRAPTALVKVRSDKTLPTWTSVADAKGRIAWIAGAGDPF